MNRLQFQSVRQDLTNQRYAEKGYDSTWSEVADLLNENSTYLPNIFDHDTSKKKNYKKRRFKQFLKLVSQSHGITTVLLLSKILSDDKLSPYINKLHWLEQIHHQLVDEKTARKILESVLWIVLSAFRGLRGEADGVAFNSKKADDPSAKPSEIPQNLLKICERKAESVV